MRIALVVFVIGITVTFAGVASAQTPPLDAKCLGAKFKCAINKQKGITGCNSKAEKLGVAVDSLCVAKAQGKFSAVATGCMARAELKPPCRTTGDTSEIESKIDAFADNLQLQLHGSNLTSGSPDACAATKDKCATNLVGGILGCRSKAYTKGLALDSLCVAKAEEKFSNLSGTGCMQKADAKVGLCDPGHSGASFNSLVHDWIEAFIDDADCELSGSSPSGTKFNVTATFFPPPECGFTVGGPSSLNCNLTYTGGGAAPPTSAGGTPPGVRTRHTASCGSGDVCTLGPTTGGNDCSDTGCTLGPWRPTPNGGTSSCVSVTFSGPASGTVRTCSGQVDLDYPLNANVVVTGNATEPCPLCTGGTCDSTATNSGASCNDLGFGVSYECHPNGLPISPFAINIPSNATRFVTATESPSGSGIFCPGQIAANKGCFGSSGCSSITEGGVQAGKLTPGPHGGIAAAVFCIPSTGNGAIDGPAGLPGPGAVGTEDAFELLP
jgi:hypothetical protein